jgi:plastocyanin
MSQQTVTITNNGFSPSPVTVDVGDFIAWINQNDSVQDATSSDGGITFQTGPIQPGGTSLPITFSNPGRIGYGSTTNPALAGIVIVTPNLSKGTLKEADMSATPTPAMQPVQVVIQNFTYNPDPIPVPVGGSVVWVNKDSMDHTATADDGSWDTGSIAPGTQSSPIQFSNPGPSTYHCTPHPFMTGTVQVG